MHPPTRPSLLAAALVLAFACPWAFARPGPRDGQAPGQTAAPTRAELVAAIRKEHEEALRAYYKVFETMKEDAEIQAYFEKNPPPAPGPWIERAWAVVDADPKDDAAMSALLFVCEEDSAGPGLQRAFAKAMEHHAASERLAEMVLCLERSSHAVALPRLRELAAKAKSRTVQGLALRSTATVLLESSAFAAKIQSMGAEELAGSYAKWMSPEELDAERKVDPVALRAEGEALLERIIKEYGDVPAKRGGTLGKACELQLYALRNLAIGKVAPDIEGKDLDGVAFKLSDYRGKVVVLDFWGDW